VSDVDISEFIAFYSCWRDLGATVTATEPPGRFGVMQIEENNNKVHSSVKKMPRRLINAVFFVYEPQIFD
jgi:glucose-1-phosphate cytidylyltransferase